MGQTKEQKKAKHDKLVALWYRYRGMAESSKAIAFAKEYGNDVVIGAWGLSMNEINEKVQYYYDRV